MARVKISIVDFLKETVYLSLYIIAVVGIVYAADHALTGTFWGGGVRPNYTPVYLWRIAISAALTLIALVLFLVLNREGDAWPLSSEPGTDALWHRVTLSRRPRQFGVLAGILFSCAFLYVFFDDPTLFRDISSDEKVVENLSALFSLVACAMFAITGFVNRRHTEKGEANFWYPLISWFFAGLFFVIAMEEIAWTQGVFFFDTPKLFENNSQGEMNLHNFATFYFEMAYYSSTFLFFVVLPFMNDRRKILPATPVVSFFLPSRYLLYIGAFAAAYNYDTWNNMLFQFCFFLAVCLLAYYVWIDRADNHRILLTLLVLCVIAVQFSFLWMGHRVTRRPAFKEYKEFFIPFAFMYYSFEIFVRSRIQVGKKVS